MNFVTTMYWLTADDASGHQQSNADKYAKLSEMCRDEKTDGKALVGPGPTAKRKWISAEAAYEWGNFMIELSLKHGINPPAFTVSEL